MQYTISAYIISPEQEQNSLRMLHLTRPGASAQMSVLFLLESEPTGVFQVFQNMSSNFKNCHKTSSNSDLILKIAIKRALKGVLKREPKSAQKCALLSSLKRARTCAQKSA